ncbi:MULTISPECIES: hypothetical protein [Halobacterium]|uniref:DUF7511 domain-containing protein n=4 Tax=Halobacterium salinarum TaxID=2242 RepID=Q9HNG9_HALSA|nr:MULTISPECIES: hypothetical protein [Halobacterium]AAG20251.1 hypothetical protein VNG_2109H [Halobacterium salinarum NRC-1]MBB6089268.1 hypothetical protein [Halobacterium salinarum]MCF2165872.1 hypothetical protein [Halobacterium salinarum]MCF2167359.1 hypothetical protein [Halobacterium salinarum]MCF2207362.1 hypothetical protein [Halobacterium salinarum]
MSPGSRTHRDDDAVTPDEQPTSAASGRVLARVETATDGHEECTLFPADADPDTLVTTWITAADDAFTALSEWR